MFKPRMKFWIVAAVAVALMLGAAPGPSLAQDKVIKIGTIFPLTGPVALAGQRCTGVGRGINHAGNSLRFGRSTGQAPVAVPPAPPDRD